MEIEISDSPWGMEFDPDITEVWIYDANGHIVADVRYAGESHGESNAKLIAAAPRLLEIVEELVELDKEGVFNGGNLQKAELMIADAHSLIRELEH